MSIFGAYELNCTYKKRKSNSCGYFIHTSIPPPPNIVQIKIQSMRKRRASFVVICLFSKSTEST